MTEGLKGQSGVVAVYRCTPTDAACLDGQTDHPLAGWEIYEPPCSGMLSIAQEDQSTGRIHIMGTCTTWFDVASGTFH